MTKLGTPPPASDVTPEPGWIVQEYVNAPHLIDGHKYTLRLYVLITSVDPCVAFLHADGFATAPASHFEALRASAAKHKAS